MAYTCTTKVDTKPGVSDSDIFDEDAPILPYLQDVPVVKGDHTVDAT